MSKKEEIQKSFLENFRVHKKFEVRLRIIKLKAVQKSGSHPFESIKQLFYWIAL
jgi:hypothetical protein